MALSNIFDSRTKCVQCECWFENKNPKVKLCSQKCRVDRILAHKKKYKNSDKGKTQGLKDAKKYRDKNKVKINESVKKYRATPRGRFNVWATYLKRMYNVSKERFIEDFTNGCTECKYKSWHVLDYHHIDKDRRNNSSDNLIYICPNCHAKKERRVIECPK